MGNGDGARRGDCAYQLENTKRGKTSSTVFRRYKGRHVVFAAALVLLGAYYVLRKIPPVADFATRYIAHPWQRLFGRVFDFFSFSVAELLCALAAVGILAYLVFSLYKIIREPKKLQRTYATLITFIAGTLAAYALLCWLWGISFYSQSFTEQSGIDTDAVSVAELKETAIYFAGIANAVAEDVNRDEYGLYECDMQKTLNDASSLYVDLPEQFDFLNGPETHPKPIATSNLMSLSNFTGVFCPLTGEANVNMRTSDCFFPNTVAHELAHQRGVAKEQDANFAAVLACMESKDENFIYSGSLLAFAHLSDSLKQASYEDWDEACSYLGESVRRDLENIDRCWARPQTAAAQATSTAYADYLQDQGQELGLGSYGACVDLLVAYYGDTAHEKTMAQLAPPKAAA